MSFSTHTDSDEETIRLGQRLGGLLKDGDVVALVGELGSGKTRFVKGIALGVGVKPDCVVTSPSFSLVNEYEGKNVLYHMDVYRLGGLSEFLAAGLEEYLHSGGIVVMEWGERWPEILPDSRIKVELTILGEFRRGIAISGKHPRAKEVIDDFQRKTSL